LVLDPNDRILLVRFEFPDHGVWATPGGGVEPGEPDEPALRRELAEELGLHDFELGPQLWFRTHWQVGERRAGPTDRGLPGRVAAFEPEPELTPEQLRDEGVHGMRWWTPEELGVVGALRPAPTPRARGRPAPGRPAGRGRRRRRLTTRASGS